MAKVFRDFDITDFWEQSDWADKEIIEQYPSVDVVAAVEAELGFKLPKSYIELARAQNGGCPSNNCHRTAESTSWAEDHVAITAIKGIGHNKIWSLCGTLGSQQSIDEWEYPPIGIYFGDCPSAGHDMLCLDYRECGPAGEPKVVHIAQEFDYKITFVAQNFEAFVRGLEPEDAFEFEDLDGSEGAPAVISVWVNEDFAVEHGIRPDRLQLSARPWWAFWRPAE